MLVMKLEVQEPERLEGTAKQHSTLPVEVLSQALAATKARIANLQVEIAALEKRVATETEEASLLQRILSLRTGASPNKVAGAAEVARDTSAAQSGGRAVVVAVIGALEAATRPLHVQELMRTLSEKQIVLPGAGKQANLIGLLRRDPRVVRPSRGMYALSSWGIPDMPAPTRRRRRHRRTLAGRKNTDRGRPT